MGVSVEYDMVVSLSSLMHTVIACTGTFRFPGDGAAATAGLAPQTTLPSFPPWLSRPWKGPLLRKLSLRAAGVIPAAASESILLEPASTTRHIHHQKSIRGHRFAVYCIMYDRMGRKIITGSDDRLVKVSLRGQVLTEGSLWPGGALAIAGIHQLIGLIASMQWRMAISPLDMPTCFGVVLYTGVYQIKSWTDIGPPAFITTLAQLVPNKCSSF